MNIFSSIALCPIACCLLMCALPASSQPNTRLRPERTVLLYRSQASSLSDPVQGKQIEPLGLPMTEDNGLEGDEDINPAGNIGNISADARFDLYFPKKPNGQMVIVCPGGGYSIVSSYNEGVYVAEWMTERGITVAVVKYRLPNGHWEIPLCDVQNTFRYCREHAGEWGIKQIGVMGFSAGGHLAASATTLYTDSITRPDFSILIYPVIAMDETPSHKGSKDNLLGNDGIWDSTEGKTADEWLRDQALHKELIHKYSLQNNVTEDTPPVFLTHCTDDNTVPVINSIIFYRALEEKGVDAEMHIFPRGWHGWGFTSLKYAEKDSFDYARKEFETSLERWLSSQRPAK